MSLAAKEMTVPPVGIRYAKTALLLQLGALIGHIMASVEDHTFAADWLLYAYWSLHFSVCAILGHTAAQMQRRWWPYALLPLLAPLVGPLAALQFLPYWRHTRN